MSAMDSFLKKLKLNGEDDDDFIDDNEDYYDDDEQEEEEEVITPIRRESSRIQQNQNAAYERSEERMPKASAGRNASGSIHSLPSNNRQKRGGAVQADLEICAIKPKSMEDTREVTDTLLKNKAVVLNLEGIDVELAQRIVDFVSGSCYAMRGNLQKISRYIFIITPGNVDISGDFQDVIGGLGN